MPAEERRLIARYHFATELHGFDYYGWQAMVADMGATEIVFDLPDVMTEEQRRKFDSIIAPGPAMLGLRSRLGTDGQTLTSSRFRYLIAYMREHGAGYPRLRSMLPPGSAEYTVTMRRQRINAARNSDEEVWRTFAKEICALVIEDYDDVPITLHQRMALYAGARMNFGIVGGPIVACSWSVYPCATFGWEWSWGNGFYEKCGLRHGDAMPWLGPKQFTIWEIPTLDFLRRWFEQWRK